ncbi:hypothetical protein AB835_00360 [Candidatus Endobugula sertula]|uniref:Uncharacterized protein n=1 Tax=Candidatus Endobugula sertula TaxID=62101 RepID=A0A1D2QTW2_9GAMM|nr:hypothetical protein AB835_00360 [Candidatus Endobugula sertula]
MRLSGLLAIPPDAVSNAHLKTAFECLSMSQSEAKATLEKLKASPVFGHVWQNRLQQLQQAI